MKNILKTLAFISLAALAFALGGCREDAKSEYRYSERLVSRIYINTELSIYEGQVVAIQGRGFTAGDKAVFRSEKSEVVIPLVETTDTYAKFVVPGELERGNYVFYITRGDAEQKVCNITVWITTEFDIPDRDGFNIKGVVFCGKEGLAGVAVSDGITTTVTDENGYYWLASDKSNGYVFVSLPSGYMPVTGDNVCPGFWMPVSSDAGIDEQCNFELKSVDNTDHFVIFAADLHLANRDSANGDMSQFRDGFMVDSQALAAEYGTERTYAIVLGDLTWDHYWYVQKYTPANYKNTVAGYCVPMFNTMGNHDNDPYVQGDFAGEAFYKTVFGPSYYSFDLGEVHYIVLDNIAWINTGGAQGIIGARDYRRNLTNTQYEWLRNDLRLVGDKSKPIVVCTHCQLHSNNNSGFDNVATLSGSGTADILDCLAGFDNVHIMTGHSHLNSTMVVADNIIEHNTAAVCECWWWGGKYSGRSVCKDGTPSGYGVFEVKGRDIKWYYKGIGCGREEQFRSYDMNLAKSILGEYVEVLDKQTDSPRDTAGDDYKDLESNMVYINVWNYDPQWKIEVTEGGTPLTVNRVFDRDPLHTLCYDIPRVQSGSSLTSSDASNRTSHMFAVKASSSSSTLEIKVTDRFGSVYTETMTRPKAFHTKMK